ncbi:MAG: ATP synthase F0 subunit A [Candidatus Lloydbacteria bacterium RIFCSPHIGHO2_02_FULL_50_11]|nr:MAG: ATP synthase F0 subunit A [Candidatus Lloydbacteria bacterium RIFCSPHIGHO2_02_FULL_50_11]
MDGIHASIVAEHMGEWAGIPITNTLVMSWIVLALLITAALVTRYRIRLVPGKVQVLLELLVGTAYDYVEEVLESKTLARKYFPFLMTIFLFILTANLLEFIPGVGSIGFYVTEAGHSAPTEFIPLLRSLATDLNMPLALAIIAFIVIEVAGIVTFGFFCYMKRFFNFHSPLAFLVGIIELVSEFIRLISFSFRLFGNIFAGEVLIAVALFFAPYIAPVPFMAFEVFVGFIQAAIFAMLTLFFIKLAVTEAAH